MCNTHFTHCFRISLDSTNAWNKHSKNKACNKKKWWSEWICIISTQLWVSSQTSSHLCMFLFRADVLLCWPAGVGQSHFRQDIHSDVSEGCFFFFFFSEPWTDAPFLLKILPNLLGDAHECSHTKVYKFWVIDNLIMKGKLQSNKWKQSSRFSVFHSRRQR